MLRRLGEALIGVGFAAFLAGFVASLGEAPRLDRFELPLGDAEGLAIDEAERIYVASRAYRRIQRYDSSGRFERSWYLAGGKGKVALAPHPAGGITVAIAGLPIQRIAPDGERHSMPDDRAAATPAPRAGGVEHRLEAPWLGLVRVVRIENGSERTVLQQSGLLWLLRSPLPAWLIALAGIVLSFIGRPAKSPLAAR